MSISSLTKKIFASVLVVCMLTTTLNIGLVSYAVEDTGIITQTEEGENGTIPDEGWGDEDEPVITETVVSSAQELETALANEYDRIDILCDFVVDRTFYVTKNTTIFSREDITLTRDAAFGGDIFVFGPEEKPIDEATEPVTINFGSDEAKITIDGNKDNVSVDVNGTVFFVRNLANVTLNNTVVQNAKKVGNERVLEEAYAGLSYASQIGGAAVILTSGKLDIYDSEFTNNEVNIYETDTVDSVSGRGAAIYSFGELNVYNSTFADNHSTKGGAIYNYRETHLNDTTFERNTASTLGGAIYVPSSTVAFVYTDNVTFAENIATDGGAIFAYGTCDLKNTSFTNNEATTGNGGAIYVSGKKTDKKSLETTNVTYCENIAAKSGGAVYVDDGAQVSFITDTYEGNQALGASGGAVYIKSGATAVIDGATFTGNKTLLGHGGAIAATGIADGTERTFELYNSSFTENQAYYNGGAIYFSTNAIAYLENVTFTKNEALATENTSGKRYGGGAVYSTGSTIEIDTAEFIENKSGYMGGAFEMHSSSSARLNNITATGNIAEGLSGGAFEIQSSSTISMNNVAASSNTALNDRGGFMDVNGAQAKIWNSVIEENLAKVGGAIAYQEGSDGGIYNTEFNKNESTNHGGALHIYTNGEKVTLHTIKFNNNIAGGFGGAVYVSKASLLDMYNITAKGNSAESGGFMYETTTGTVVNLNGLTVSD
ncbi:MAG: hypothetical protein IKV64_04770, partial [Clostridia bacterium]|nr:hypothetical protein [Clostridia bacterium]